MFALLVILFTIEFQLDESYRLLVVVWIFLSLVLCLLSPFCAIAGIVFGILGRGTQGRFYGYAGIVLSLLCGMTVSPLAMFFAYRMLVPCC